MAERSQFRSERWRTAKAADGKATFAKVLPGKYRVRVGKREATVEVTAGKPASVDLSDK